MSLILTALTVGTTLGVSAGLAPGPMTTMVLSEAIKGGPKEGIKIAFAPLLTDIPVLLVAMWLTSHLGTDNTTMAILSFAGAGMLLFLAWDGWKTAVPLQESGSDPQKSVFLRGLITSAVSPNPILFWMTIGAETIRVTLGSDLFSSGIFVASFYVMLLFSKILLAWAGGHSRAWIGKHHLIFVNRGLAGVLGVFGLVSMWKGLTFLH